MPYLDPNNDAFTLNDYTLPWQMSRWEKYTFYTLLESIKPECAIEIGTYKGGSLQVISDFSRHVYSIDIDSELSLSAQKGFTNTEFLWGKSREILPELLERIAESGEKLNFVLVDGEHTPEGVKSDIEMILQYKPECPLYMVMHDSFNPSCRQGITSVDWAENPYVHYVEVDFVPGVFFAEAYDTAPAGSMFAGFALALMKPEKRTGKLNILESQKGLYDIVYEQSCHRSQTQSAGKLDITARLKLKILGKLGLLKE